MGCDVHNGDHWKITNREHPNNMTEQNRRLTDAPGWGDNIERIMRIAFLGIFVTILGGAMAYNMLVNGEDVPGSMVSLVGVALGFLAAERPLTNTGK